LRTRIASQALARERQILGATSGEAALEWQYGSRHARRAAGRSIGVGFFE
jgi:hypothetical protein